MTCHHEPHDHDYRAATVTGDLAAFLHRHNRALILIGAALAVAGLVLAL